jgi:Transglycosylase SLT domain
MYDPMKIALMALAVMLPSGCMQMGAKPEVTMAAAPAMGWDHRPEAPVWTEKTLLAVAAEDTNLADTVPRDIGAWCPGYAKADIVERRAFWAGLMSAVAKHESTWNPAASGGGGQWIGLMQIAPRTAQQYGCEATSTAALKDGGANLQCAVEIAATQIGRDDAVAGSGNAGMGRDWAPFRNASKRAEMAAWTSAQAYCQG